MKPIPPIRKPKVFVTGSRIIPRPATLEEARAMAQRLPGAKQGCRFLTGAEIDKYFAWPLDDDDATVELRNGVEEVRRALAR